jgi:hypothetical protein
MRVSVEINDLRAQVTELREAGRAVLAAHMTGDDERLGVALAGLESVCGFGQQGTGRWGTR